MKFLDEVKKVLTAKEAAGALRVSLPTFYTIAKREDFPTIRIGSKILVPLAQLEEWLEREATA